ncbi:MAG: phospholipid/cholesterol/gamma-HCH transport system substrate-binding protein [Crocinitomicaceae bacterium]|jgi:phospholipid/cholesterol/gamma-HCH transport system substrate-binding protein
MKLSKEIITGVITLAAVALLIAGVNFLKGNSFFGGDKEYYAYFPSSGGVTPATSVYVNGVDVGKVMSIEYLPNAKDSTKRVKITFNISTENLQIVKGSTVEAGGIDLLTKGLIVHMNSDYSAGYFNPGSTLPGFVSVDMMSQVQAYADPITKKLQGALVSIDNMVQGVSAFWDTTATSELEASMREIKIAIRKFGNAADQIEGLLTDERIRLARIMNNVEEITVNLRKSNDTVKAIIGNVKQITDDLVTADFKETIAQATQTIKHVNKILDEAAAGNGTLGKLLTDDKLYYDIIESNQALQGLVKDLQAHPERYIHFSVFGAKTKGVPLTVDEEEKLKELLKK